MVSEIEVNLVISVKNASTTLTVIFQVYVGIHNYIYLDI